MIHMQRIASTAADKTTFCAFLCMFCVVCMSSCGQARTTNQNVFKNNQEIYTAADNPDRESRLHAVDSTSPTTTDGGVNLALVAQSKKPKDNSKSKSKDRDGKKPENQSSKPESQDSYYALVLGTFADDNHEMAAAKMVENLRTVAPQINGARVHTTASGSLVIFGRYADREDPAAKSDEEKLKQIKFRNQPVFKRIIITKIDTPNSGSQLNPFDLRAARQKHPNVDPLYTLDIAVWIANEDPKAPRDERLAFEDAKKQAEKYVSELRAQGFEAYFFHELNGKRSSVTVGLFDRRAMNEVSKLYSPEVTALLKKFPVRTANGAPVHEWAYKPVDQRRGKAVTVPQAPVLVLVPKE